MKPTSLSPEFYENLYNNVIRDYDFDPDCDDPEESQCSTYIEVEDFEGYYICFKATFELNLIDDSFDHAFGTEYGWHMEIGELTDIEEMTISDEDGNDLSDLFDYDKFWEQFKQYTVKFYGGSEVNTGDIVLVEAYRGTWDERKFIYKDTLTGYYHTEATENSKYRTFVKSFKRIAPNTEANRKNLRIA